MAVCSLRSDEVRNAIRLCNLASARLVECGSALRGCSGRLDRFRARLRECGLTAESEALILESLASACEQTADRLCEAAGELASSSTPDEVLHMLAPLTRLTTRLLNIAERRARMLTSLLEVPAQHVRGVV